MSEVALTMRKHGAAGLRLLIQGFTAQWVFFVVPALYLFTNYLLFRSVPEHAVAPFTALALDILEFSIPAGAIIMLVLRLVQFAVIIKPESPTRALWSDIKGIFTRPALLANALPIFIAMIFYNKAMIELKPVIPEINPFKWDEAFMKLDRAMHGGLEPWALLQPLMGYDYITLIVNLAYDFWFVALVGSWVWFAFQRQAGELRTRFFLSYMLIWWIGGGLLAVYFSSAGPCYFSKIGLSPDPYQPLLSYLRELNGRIPIWSVSTQDLLWKGYITKNDPIGISAFPSMHNASAVLFALAFRQVSKFWGRFFAGYALIVFLGSIHLGWHYAVDGYAAIVLAALCWWLSAPITRWAHGLPVMKRYNENLQSIGS